MRKSPYDAAPDRSFWSRAVAQAFRPADIIAPTTVLMRANDRLASAGSCFASNLVPYLERSGFTYVRMERRPKGLRIPAENLGYDNFSAAFGNIYTPRQLLQLLRRSTGKWQPQECVWQIGDEFVDPFRPGLRYRARSAREFDVLTRQHLDCVTRMFLEANVFVFTLGLTEAWISCVDGAVFPACPGTVAGTYDADRHAFHNMSVAEVLADLTAFIVEVRRLNPTLRIILTVSPVPLVATATGGHVLEASIYSKAVLRAAAGEVVQSMPETIYFPAYEIVTGPQAPASFFGPDCRSVTQEAVATVMRAFLSHCETGVSETENAFAERSAAAAKLAAQALSQIVTDIECEEGMSDPRPTGAGC